MPICAEILAIYLFTKGLAMSDDWDKKILSIGKAPSRGRLGKLLVNRVFCRLTPLPALSHTLQSCDFWTSHFD